MQRKRLLSAPKLALVLIALATSLASLQEPASAQTNFPTSGQVSTAGVPAGFKYAGVIHATQTKTAGGKIVPCQRDCTLNVYTKLKSTRVVGKPPNLANITNSPNTSNACYGPGGCVVYSVVGVYTCATTCTVWREEMDTGWFYLQNDMYMGPIAFHDMYGYTGGINCWINNALVVSLTVTACYWSGTHNPAQLMYGQYLQSNVNWTVSFGYGWFGFSNSYTMWEREFGNGTTSIG